MRGRLDYLNKGGSYHEKTIDNFIISSAGSFAWSYDIRPDRKICCTGKEEVFVPFYEGKVDPNLPVSPSTPSVTPSVNPFDQSKPSSPLNPFDQVPATNNPFEQVESENPFEQLPTNNQNPFDAVDAMQGNPFESGELKPKILSKQLIKKSKIWNQRRRLTHSENLPEKKTKEEDPYQLTHLKMFPCRNPFDAVPQ